MFISNQGFKFGEMQAAFFDSAIGHFDNLDPSAAIPFFTLYQMYCGL